jgi:hypothetical protein
LVGVRLGLSGWAAFADGFQRDAGVDSEAGLRGGVDVEEAGHGGGQGVAIKDSGVAKDVHEEGVGAVGGVELAPPPIVAGAGAAGGGMDLGEAAEPGRVGADAGVGCGVEVAVTALLVAAEDDDGGGAGGDVVEEVLSAGEMVGSGA